MPDMKELPFHCTGDSSFFFSPLHVNLTHACHTAENAPSYEKLTIFVAEGILKRKTRSHPLGHFLFKRKKIEA